MKYLVLILDGAAGWPLESLGGATTLAAATTPNLDAMARAGRVGMATTVPEGMEPSSATACMSILGYDPRRYEMGRGAIEAASLGIELGPDDVAFRCNLVSVVDDVMADYSCGHIANEDSHRLIANLQAALGNEDRRFFPGLSYRHVLRLTDQAKALAASCTPPHDIIGKPITRYLPSGRGSGMLVDLMEHSKAVLADDPVNAERMARREPPASMIWLFWGGAKPATTPSFTEVHDMSAAMTSAVDLLGGLAEIFSIERLAIAGVTDGHDNDYAAQAEGGLAALDDHDLVVIHVESPDEAGHGGDAADKVEALEAIDREVVAPLKARADAGEVRILAMPDHPTPIALRTHAAEPVPFVIYGPGIESNGARSYSEGAASSTGVARDAWELLGELKA